jgi:hypothetical protein
MKIAIMLLSVAVAACSSTSKEVYTEKRTLTYPKGQTPHIKDMYLQPQQPQQQHTYVGTNAPQPADDYSTLFAPVSESRWDNQDLPSENIYDLERENYYLTLMAKNKMLKGIQ